MTAAFLDKLELEYLDGKTWRLTSVFRYQAAAGNIITIPAGFLTDFASIPRGLWNVLPPTSACGDGAVVHDYLYSTQPCTRAQADGILIEAMAVQGIGRLTRALVWAGVRVGGAGIWERHRQALTAKLATEAR